MERWAAVIFWGVSLVLVLGCGEQSGGFASATEETPDTDGLWVLSLAEFDSEPFSFNEPLFLEVDGSQISGDSVCNDFGGEIGGQFEQTLEGCDADDDSDPDLSTIEAALIEGARNGPRIEGGQLVVDEGGFRFFYDRAEDVTPEELYAVLGDDSRVADPSEIFLDPEAGGSHRPFDRLVRLDQPDLAVRFYLGIDGSLVCLIASTDTESFTACQEPRVAARTAYAYELNNRDGPTGVQVALIPDSFAEAVAQRPDLGESYANTLLIKPNAAPGEYTIVNESGERFLVDIPG